MISASAFDDRRKVFAWVHLVSGLSLSFFIVTHLLEGCCYALALTEFLLVLVMSGTYWRIRRGASLASVEDTLMASAVTLFSALVFFESMDNTGAYWIAGFPFVAYFVHRVNKARYWVGFFALEILMAAVLQSTSLIQTPYSVSQLLCLVAIVLFFWLFAHIYQSQLESRKLLLQQSYQELAIKQRHIRAILDHSPIGIWMIDTNGRLQFLNHAWVQWSGISEASALQSDDYTTLMPDELAKNTQVTDKACLEGDGAYYFRQSLPCADGETRTFDMIKIKLTGEDGEATGLVGFAIDVSKQVAAEDEQLLLERQMQHAQRLESMGVMAGGIAHDFNNLLTAIKGSVDLLMLEPVLPDTAQNSIHCIDEAAQAASALCSQMLAYSGKGLVKYEVFYIRDAIKSMQSLVEVTVGKHVILQWDFGQQPTAIEADRAQFGQVLLNLVTNASEAIAPDVQGRIDISVSRKHLHTEQADRFFGAELKAGCYAVLCIADNGSGMDKNTIEHMFDPFFTTKFTGRGLGLSAILGILRTHHGGIEIESEPGQGTRISAWLPCSEKKVSVMPVDESGHDIEQAGFSGRVLLVDDEEGVLQVASRMLEKLGFDVVMAGNGKQAVEIFSADQDFSWVLLDVTMPEMDGNECLQRLREIKPDIHVVMSSGYNIESALIPVHDCRPDDFLTKPFSFDTLRTAAQHAMRT